MILLKNYYVATNPVVTLFSHAYIGTDEIGIFTFWHDGTSSFYYEGPLAITEVFGKDKCHLALNETVLTIFHDKKFSIKGHEIDPMKPILVKWDNEGKEETFKKFKELKKIL